MINSKALKILGAAIEEATKIQADFITIQREMEGLATREQIASSEIMRYLKFIGGGGGEEMALHVKCEECGKKFTPETGREYVQLCGGQWVDVCKACAEVIATGDRQADL